MCYAAGCSASEPHRKNRIVMSTCIFHCEPNNKVRRHAKVWVVFWRACLSAQPTLKLSKKSYLSLWSIVPTNLYQWCLFLISDAQTSGFGHCRAGAWRVSEIRRAWCYWERAPCIHCIRRSHNLMRLGQGRRQAQGEWCAFCEGAKNLSNPAWSFNSPRPNKDLAPATNLY